MDYAKLWVIEYSPAQDAFSVETAAASIETNIRQFYGRLDQDCFITLGIFETEAEARQKCAELQAWRNARERRRGD